MTEVEVAVLAAMVRTRRDELRLTRRGCTEAGGPPVATLRAIEQGHLARPAGDVLTQLDEALRWPPGTARTALCAPPHSTSLRATAPLTLRQRKLLYCELATRRAAPEAIAVAGEMLAQALRAQLRYAIESADVDVLLEIDKLLITWPMDTPAAGRPDRQGAKGRGRRPAPEVLTPEGPISLRELRLNRGWSLDDVVTKVNALQQIGEGRGVVSRGTLSAIETGLRGMSVTMAQQLEQAYGLPPATLPVYERPGARRPLPAITRTT